MKIITITPEQFIEGTAFLIAPMPKPKRHRDRANGRRFRGGDLGDVLGLLNDRTRVAVPTVDADVLPLRYIALLQKGAH